LTHPPRFEWTGGRRSFHAIVFRHRGSPLGGIALIALLGGLVACGQPIPIETTTPIPTTIPIDLSTAVPTDVPTIEAAVTVAPTAVDTVTPVTPTPEPTLVEEKLPSPTTVSISAPTVSTPATNPVPAVTRDLSTPKPATPGSGPVKPAQVESQSVAPIQLVIPKIGVKASVESVGVDRLGAMATPSGPFTVGWWSYGTVPGEPGNAVLDGHLDSARYGAAVFWRLGDLRSGDQILVRMPGNRTLTFIVDRAAVYKYNDAPLADIFGAASTPSLNLVTCTGSFDRTSRNYDRRLVVYSKLQKT
jgi:sortase (surface protein transpeptidase)